MTDTWQNVRTVVLVDRPDGTDTGLRVATGATPRDSLTAPTPLGPGPAALLDHLTPREREVLALMARGRSNSGIATALFITVPAVERHITGIFSKLNLSRTDGDAHRRVVAVLLYLRGQAALARSASSSPGLTA